MTVEKNRRLRNDRKFGYEMTENDGYEMARLRNDWHSFPCTVLDPGSSCKVPVFCQHTSEDMDVAIDHL